MFPKFVLFGDGSNMNQIICAILINLPVFGYGASMGWMSPMTLLLQSKRSPKGIPLTDIEVSWMASITYLSAAFTGYPLARLGDKIGRKRTLIFVSITSTISWILLLCSMDIWAMIMARVFVGVTMSGCYITCPVYTKEISSDNLRGALGCMTMAFHTIGNLFLFVIGDFLEYQTILWLCLGIPLLHVILFTTMPESPSYLVKKGKNKEASEVLFWLRCQGRNSSSIEQELNRIMAEQKHDEETKNSGFKAIWNDKTLFKAFSICLITVLARDLCGVITFLNFAGEIFSISSEGTGIVLSPNQQAMILGSVQVVASAIATSTIERVGRKLLLSSTACLSGVSMLVLASWFVAKKFEITISSWVPVISLCICIFCDSAGLLPVSNVLCSELFSFKYRSIVLAITLTLAEIIDFLQIILFKTVTNYLGIYVIFYSFGFICLASAMFIIKVTPDTKGRCLEDIYKDLVDEKTDKNCSRL